MPDQFTTTSTTSFRLPWIIVPIATCLMALVWPDHGFVSIIAGAFAISGMAFTVERLLARLVRHLWRPYQAEVDLVWERALKGVAWTALDPFPKDGAFLVVELTGILAPTGIRMRHPIDTRYITLKVPGDAAALLRGLRREMIARGGLLGWCLFTFFLDRTQIVTLKAPASAHERLTSQRALKLLGVSETPAPQPA